MFIIQKISQRYDPHEDRLCLSASNPLGETCALWLTQRLANQLALSLAQWLDETLHQLSDRSAARDVHAWEQAAAQAALRADEPVSTPMPPHLLHSIDLSRQDDIYGLTFRWAPEGAAQLTLNATELRQWLGILAQLYRSGEWPMHAWPTWITNPSPHHRARPHALH